MNFEKMSNAKLDAEVATQIMGWAYEARDVQQARYDAGWCIDIDDFRKNADWSPATKWSDVHKAIDALREKGYTIDLSSYPAAFGVLVQGSQTRFPVYENAPNVAEPRTVCIALLRALEAERERETADAGEPR